MGLVFLASVAEFRRSGERATPGSAVVSNSDRFSLSEERLSGA